MTSAKHAIFGAGQWLVDVAFPPHCPSCSAPVAAQGNFCSGCFAALRQISAPHCACCGIPFAFEVGADIQCPECLSEPPAFDTARAALVYDAISAPLVRSLKFHDQYSGLQRYVRMMQSALGPQADAIDIVVPVPLHWRRLVRRRYNQSALLAFALAKALALPCMPGLLQRAQHTTPQMRLTRQERLKNVARAFRVPPNAMDVLTDKTVLLVDDVVTTGATVDACAAALKKAGVATVHVVALARTVKE